MNHFVHWIDAMTPELIWGVFSRVLGAVYFIAIAQLFPQVLPFAGSRGISPVKQQLQKIQEDYPGWRRLLYFPTLIWINASDWFLKALIVLGASAALVVIYGGTFTKVAFFICWLVYLSLDIAMGLSYPWDCLLLEAGFLAVFLPTLNSLPNLSMSAAPLPLLAWAFRCLLFRLMLGFGKYKFWGASLKDAGYIRSFMVNIPLPTYAAWFAFRLPRWFFQFSIVTMFVTEVVLPFFIFVPGLPRVLVAIAIASLMSGIQLTGNFGFFNILTIALCIPLLDYHSSILISSWFDPANLWTSVITNGVIAILFVGGIINFPFNSWCTQTWLHWTSLLKIQSRPIAQLLNFYRILARFRITHAYGVFPPESGPPIRWVPVIEGTQDGKIWKEYHYQVMTTDEGSPPRYVAPYHPRLDHAIFYEAFGTNDISFAASTVGTGSPYGFLHTSWLECLLQRLLEGESTVMKLFRDCPFPADSPPVAVRVNLYRYEPTTWEERKRTGRWWIRKFAGTHLPETRLNAEKWQQRYPDPDLFHWDWLIWKRRSPKMQRLIHAARTGCPERVAIAASVGLGETVENFWNQFLDQVAHQAGDWDSLPKVVEELKRNYSSTQLQDFEKLMGRLSFMLSSRLEPHFFGTRQPEIRVKNYFQLGLLIHHIIGKGRATYEAVLQNPAEAIEHLEDFTTAKGFYYLGIFWLDPLIFQARKFRLVQQLAVIKTDEILPGFVELVPFLSQQFREIGEENLPTMKRLDNRDWQIIEHQR